MNLTLMKWTHIYLQKYNINKYDYLYNLNRHWVPNIFTKLFQIKFNMFICAYMYIFVEIKLGYFNLYSFHFLLLTTFSLSFEKCLNAFWIVARAFHNQ